MRRSLPEMGNLARPGSPMTLPVKIYGDGNTRGRLCRLHSQRSSKIDPWSSSSLGFRLLCIGRETYVVY